ncbi:MAG: hypothetical protein A2Y62_12530 [Candidatus Fischerbacteria bacterium RBG_13_37_8]|uniref:Uncharacterized protein n=1 Tax=Candidatus Fischerbacteria bacterium RBG_13_37_8 TaxID=1817863 RepID=A0A1F5VSE0_9BACT|nr:MAG: hypothetical protein A2Y62_12530 [Candidatus Fischerbacteria bacterium RBG_13_37_8]
MQKIGLMILLLFGIFLVQSNVSYTQVQAGISVDDEGVQGFYLSVGEYYHVPEKEVIVVRERKIPDEEIPVVFFLASKAKVPSATLIDMRLGGKSWMDISLHFGLGADIFYVPVTVMPGPPYGRAYGYYKNKPQKEWKKIVLVDDDIVNLVNLKFISAHYGYSPEEVIKLRAGGYTFIKINGHCKKAKKEKAGKPLMAPKPDKVKAKETGKGKKK